MFTNCTNVIEVLCKSHFISEYPYSTHTLRGRELWRKLYRINFTKPYKKDVLAGTSNLMIWSDNDVANDFTTMKNESGEQAYHPKFMVCGMEAYKVRLRNYPLMSLL